MQARIPRLAETRVLFSWDATVQLQRPAHQYNVVAEGVDGAVPPGASTCGIEDTDVEINSPAMAAVSKIQFFW
jgi:phage baseplate assembly protein gpV